MNRNPIWYGFRAGAKTIRYCWFSVSRHSKKIKIKNKTVQKIKSRIWEMKGGTYTKTLAKIQVGGIFRIRDIRRNVLPKLTEICMEICMYERCICMEICMLVLTWMSTNMADGNKQKHNRVLLQKREFILRETHNTSSKTRTV